MDLYRLGQLFESLPIHAAARLVRIWLDFVDWGIDQRIGSELVACIRRRRGARWNERIQPTP
jgi:hypothetical protein